MDCDSPDIEINRSWSNDGTFSVHTNNLGDNNVSASKLTKAELLAWLERELDRPCKAVVYDITPGTDNYFSRIEAATKRMKTKIIADMLRHNPYLSLFKDDPAESKTQTDGKGDK